MKLKILILYNARFTRDFIQRLLSDNRYVVDVRATVNEIKEISRLGSFDVLISDVVQSQISSYEYLTTIRRSLPTVHIIGMGVGHDSREALESLGSGLVDQLVCPFDEEKLIEAIESFNEKFIASRNNLPHKEFQNNDRQTSFDNMIGQSVRMREIFSKIASVADKDISVLIGGESGTGKELVAQAIHNHSHRKNGPFIKVNCAAIPDTLIESELFGHEKGSFTGAFDRKIGKFEMADNGTLFLDEVGDMSMTTQSKVLRIIQEREFERIGGNRPIKINVRIITATHRDLVLEVREKRFREDLFFRLNVVSILLPPLRERRDDILLLCEFFVQKFCSKFGKPQKKISLDVIDAFMNFEWPGNIRELQNMIEGAIAIEDGPVISIGSLPYSVLRTKQQSYGRRKTDSGETGAAGIDLLMRKTSGARTNAFAAPHDANEAEIAAGGAKKETGQEKDDRRLQEAIRLLIDSNLTIDRIEELVIRSALSKTSGRQLAAARLMGIGKGEIQYKIKKYGIKLSDFKAGPKKTKEHIC